MNVSIGVKTDVGKVREANEDSYLVQEPLFVVADGMGGHIAGDVASSTAVGIIESNSDEASADDPETLARLIKSANDAIWKKAQDDPSLRGMGTTCTLILIHDETAHIAHVGDSRAYLWRRGELAQITEDHTLVERMVKEGRLKPEEAQKHPQRSIITRALGVDPEVDVDLRKLDLERGDRLLICSDGLTSMIDPPVISEVLASDKNPQSAAERLVELANEAGGEDNVTVVVIDVGGAEAAAPPAPSQERTGRVDTVPRPDSSNGERARATPPPPPMKAASDEVLPAPRRTGRIVFWLLLVVALLGGGYALARMALDNSWYVGVNGEDMVTIYRGIPEEVGSLELAEVEEETTISLSDIPEFQRERVRRGIKADSLEDAHDTVDGLRDLAKDPEFQNGDQNKQGGGG